MELDMYTFKGQYKDHRLCQFSGAQNKQKYHLSDKRIMQFTCAKTKPMNRFTYFCSFSFVFTFWSDFLCFLSTVRISFGFHFHEYKVVDLFTFTKIEAHSKQKMILY